jgi:CheY-like chemotaxis protein
VLGLAQSLTADPRLLDDQRLKAETLERAGRHLLAVAGDVLDLARAEAGKLDVVCRPVPLRDLLSDCEALTRASAEAKGLALRVATAPGVPDAVLADPTRLRQVLLNLLSNAVKFTPAGGCVELRAVPAGAEDSARLRIEVADTGPGIPADQRGRLFHEFSQLGETGGTAGAGLGLAICMALTGAMGGRIGQHPGAGGRGSVFWVELPGAPGMAAAAEAATGSPAPRPAPSDPAHVPAMPPPPLRLLVVDDIATNRMVLRLLLQQDGHEVLEAASGRDAVEALAAGGFDAVLMDAWMPDGDGLEATRRIRRLAGPAASVPIIGLTADARPAQLEECLAAGMDGCLAKPLQKAALLAALAKARAAAPERSSLASA